MRKLVLTCAVMAACFVSSGRAMASVIWDWSPVTTGSAVSDGYSNALTVQSFAEAISFANAAQVTGMDIYVLDGYAEVGDSATIRLWADASGQPGAVIFSFTELVSVIDTLGANAGEERLHVDFTTPLNLSSGTTYWIGMASTDSEFTQTGLVAPGNPGDSMMAQFNGGDVFSDFTSPDVGDMAFRLEGTVVPEPSSLALLGWGGVGLVIAACRRRVSEA